jgi:hypothetical protein
MIKYYIKIFRFRIRKEYVFYWKRFYRYGLKRLLANIEHILIIYIKIFFKQLKYYNYFINLKKVQKDNNKFFFFFYYLFKEKNKWFLNNSIIFKNFFYINNLFKLKFLEKKDFNVFIFNNIKNKYYLFLRKLKNKMKQLNIIIRMKILIFLKNFLFLFFLQLFIIWINNFFLLKTKKKFFRMNFNIFNINKKLVYRGLKYINKSKWNCLSVLNFNYFFYDNIIIKKVVKSVREKNF